MKKLLLLAAIAVFGMTSANAQDGIGFGVKLGVNVASLGGDSYGVGSSLGSRTSFHVGGLAEIPLSEKFALQPELLYSSEGSDWSIGNSDALKLDYIRVPILAKYYIIEGLSAEAGPVLGVLISADSDGNDVKDNFNTFDAGIGVGASYRLDMGVFFSLRYNKGLMNVNDTDADFSNQSNVFQVSAGYRF